MAFDVYRAVGGSERLRRWTMNGICVGFVVGMTIQVLVSLAGDRATYRPGNLRRSWRAFRASPLSDRQLWGRLRQYNLRDFHPEDRDTTALVEAWRTELFGDHGTLNDRLGSVGA